MDRGRLYIDTARTGALGAARNLNLYPVRAATARGCERAGTHIPAPAGINHHHRVDARVARYDGRAATVHGRRDCRWRGDSVDLDNGLIIIYPARAR